MDYTGTVVFVSHDRYFIDKLATRVFEIGDGKVEVYPGNYEDYLWRKQGGNIKQNEAIRQQLKEVQPEPDRLLQTEMGLRSTLRQQPRRNV